MFKNLRFDVKRNKFLLILCAPAILWFCIFSYAPLCGLVVAFQKYSPAKGIFGSDLRILSSSLDPSLFFGSHLIPCF